ncbi:hypothetical protein [Cellulosimicrobium marinum]|uniref:hypothetical protein n=1 Tax=Cellulosimicrobium marinum TaxID=1638992 RepID=UPI001E2D4D13|nr:hypothetical protein [Cellulosimicrobium marinum]MCB7135221.1 hypothetical protein [Cellulosimicrobium marinum]
MCDVEWPFVPSSDDWAYWGTVMEAAPEWGNRPKVWIANDVAAYATGGDASVDYELLEQHIQTTVRHELGHILNQLLDLDDAYLKAVFGAQFDYTEPDTNLGYETSAEAIAVALTPPAESRTWFYEEDVTAATSSRRGGSSPRSPI